jgi:hypothetical protein
MYNHYDSHEHADKLRERQEAQKRYGMLENTIMQPPTHSEAQHDGLTVETLQVT